MSQAKESGSSFRNPSSYLITQEGKLYQQYQAKDDKSIAYRLYKALLQEQLLITHQEVEIESVTRENIFPDYTATGFETVFGVYFNIRHMEPIQDSERLLNSMESKVG